MNLSDALKADYFGRYPAEAARIVEQSNPSQLNISQVPALNLAPLLERVDPAQLRELFLVLPEATQLEVISALSTGTTLTLLRHLTEAEREGLFTALPDGSESEIRMLLAFPEGTAGYYMDRLYGHYRTSMTVREALERVRDSNRRRARSIYITDEDGKLAGRVDLQDMALSSDDALMSSLLNPAEGSARLISQREELVKTFDQYRTDSIPVVDQDNKLIGVVRYAALFQAAEDAATVNIQTMVGASADERALSPALFAVKKRLPWLHINLLTAFLAASVVGLFEATIAQFTALAILLPVVAGQSGNAGSQALAVTMRGLALKEVTGLQWKVVLAKELKVGVIDGIVLALTCGLGVFVWSQSFGLALVIAIAMVCSMVAAGLAGALVPMILIRVGQDPATASSIILTTVTDVAGFISFLGTATLLSSIL
ncbi:magnesium transporter [Oceanicoccus sp. KOV_DT_Chl]|uniref:magnesium transporter n=1 Tax=Oceanicoccus sp. KOV_DT_Chl TaxID=1904639 RepID=UPI000C7C32A7|nr:magnesium transporter [Oceanicoccus sp. KOV_DT_Chl]